MLTIISGALGTAISIKPKRDYEVFPFIWCIVIATSGYGKTPAVNSLMKPIDNIQKERHKAYLLDKELFEGQQKVLKRKSGKIEEPEIEEPILEHRFVSDFTVEALASVLSTTPRGVIVYVDEIYGLILGLNQYKASGNDKQHILQLFNVKSWKIDRKTKPIFIPRAGAAILGGIQPKVMTKVFSTDSFDDGLLPRFIHIVAHKKDRKFTLDVVSEEDEQTWENIINQSYQINPIGKDPQVITLNEGAIEAFTIFHDQYYKNINFVCQRMEVYIPKLTEYCLKIMLILHVLYSLSEAYDTYPQVRGSLTEETARKAIKLVDFFAGQAVNTIKLYNSDSDNPKNNPEKEQLINVLYLLQNEVSGGRLLLESIRIKYNENLPESFQIEASSAKRIGTILKGLGLITEHGNNNQTVLVWDDDRIQKIFKENLNFVNFVNKKEDTL